VPSPISAYRAEVASGAIKPDPMQQLAVEMLQTLHVRLGDYQPDRQGGVLQRFLGRGRTAPAPMGLYLYGDVGRGKSMLMDLFFAIRRWKRNGGFIFTPSCRKYTTASTGGGRWTRPPGRRRGLSVKTFWCR